jgi:hypothetical protein
MIVRIKANDWGDAPKTHDNSYYEYLNGFGLDFINHVNFKVIDKKLFFLSVIKYGISHEEVTDSKLDFIWLINKDLAIRRNGRC